MVYENEFELLKKTFQKSRVQIILSDSEHAFGAVADDTTRAYFKRIFRQETLRSLKTRTLYRFKDSMELLYMVFVMPVGSAEKIVLIGPYTEEPFSPEDILEISERNGFLPGNQRAIDEYFATIPLISKSSALFLLLEAFCERLWQGDYEIADVQDNGQLLENALSLSMGERGFDDTFLDMKNMEKRYMMENEIMDAVTTGSEYKANQIFSSFTANAFERRLADPIRNFKNYCIIMNTLLRKAAERGGVHPMHLDRISSQYAHKIEQVSETAQVQNLMADMFRAYCKLVRKNATKAYSPIVSKTVVAIEENPSAELNLRVLAKKLNVSNVYLSTVFKKETGKNLTQYIRQKRMAYAMSLLQSTHLQIQTVAQHCGMVDVQYFSKLFKQHTGKTPSQFRMEYQKEVR